MKTLGDSNPLAVCAYIIAVVAVSMFCMTPVTVLLSLFGALMLNLIKNGLSDKKSHFYFLIMFLLMALVNPLFSHNGKTILFVLNDNPITLEAAFYGVVSSAEIISVIYWFKLFSSIMTSDKLLYAFGSLSPKLSLVLSMTLRYIPLFKKQYKNVNDAQTVLGLYKQDNIVDDVMGKIRIFSVMVTWALENGIITADSMSARGYGVRRRTSYAIYKFTKSDVLFLILLIFLFNLTLLGATKIQFEYYPQVKSPGLTLLSLAVYIAYGILVFYPSIIEVKEMMKWKYLQSKI